MTSDEIKKLYRDVIDSGLKRRINVPNFKEDDYLAGAMTVMGLLNIPMPMWFLMIMAGRKVILTDLEKVQESSTENLPLLINDIKEPEAIALLEKRLKNPKSH